MDMSATLGLDRARAVDPAGYAMSGRAPRIAIRPVNRAELVEALSAVARDGLAVVPWGGGVALDRESAPERFDVALDLRGLDAIVEYEPDDLTLTAECGVTLDTLRERLEARGQELPLEAANSWGATLGGVLAANASGPRRLALGSSRDRILGARFALGSGEIARSGGKVVKNVAGYGIHRLLCGSRGALAVIVEASLKLLPAPGARAALVFGLESAKLGNAQLWSRFPRMEPAVLSVIGRAAADLNPVLAAQAPFTLVLGFEGEELEVERQCDLAHEALGAARVRLAGSSAAALWRQLADLEELQGARLTFSTSHNTPDAFGAALAELPHDRAIFHAPCGRLHLFPGDEEPGAIVRVLAARDFTLVDARGAGEIAPLIPPQHGVRSMRERIRAALDPDARFALGGRWG